MKDNVLYALILLENLCLLNDCDEYPEISPGCIICKDKLKDYKDNKKCQRCKYGYFKTKDEKCVYCSSEKYGGVGCHECGYEGDNIICKECYSDFILRTTYSYDCYCNIPIINDTKSPLLSNAGKCFDCNIQFSNACKKCQLVNIAGTETLKCISCKEGYYLTSEGICVNIMGLIPKIDNCQDYMFSSSEIKFKLTLNDDNFKFKIYNYSNYEIVSETIYSKGLDAFNKKCLTCKNGYFLNDEGICEELTYDKCTFNNIKNNYQKLKNACYTFCNSNNKVTIKLQITQKWKDEVKRYYLYSLDYSTYIEISDYLKDSDDIFVCMSNSGEGDKYSPVNLKNCYYAYYFPENKTYSCTSCSTSLDKQTNTCKESSSSTCTIVNKGTETKPKYVCDGYYYSSSIYALITYDTGEKDYKESYLTALNGCVEAIADTTYYNTKYNCTKCSFKYIPYYSNYYERNICQNLENSLIKERYSYSIYYIDNIKAKNGVCNKGNYFTRDGEYCYKCDHESVGMPGCKGSCSYSNKTDNSLKCTSECKTGYNNNDNYICTQCEENYFINEKGKCEICDDAHFKGINKCIKCGNTAEGGIDNCLYCKSNGEKAICLQCLSNYILSETENKCLLIAKNKELENFIKCDVLTKENNKYSCSKCKIGYTLTM